MSTVSEAIRTGQRVKGGLVGGENSVLSVAQALIEKVNSESQKMAKGLAHQGSNIVSTLGDTAQTLLKLSQRSIPPQLQIGDENVSRELQVASENTQAKDEADAERGASERTGLLSPRRAASSSTRNGVVQKLSTEECSKLVYFEHLFFELDPDGDGIITMDEARSLLAFTALDLTVEARERVLREVDTVVTDGMLDCEEFMDLCVATMWNDTVPNIKAAAANYAESRSTRQRRINSRWRKAADKLDRTCRIWVPGLYTLTLVGLFAINMDDDYKVKAGERIKTRNQGLEGVQISVRSMTNIVLAGVALGIFALTLLISYGRCFAHCCPGGETSIHPNDEEDEEEYVGQRVEDMVRERKMEVLEQPTRQATRGIRLPKTPASQSPAPGPSAMEQFMAFEGDNIKRGDGPVAPGEGRNGATEP